MQFIVSDRGRYLFDQGILQTIPVAHGVVYQLAAADSVADDGIEIKEEFHECAD